MKEVILQQQLQMLNLTHSGWIAAELLCSVSFAQFGSSDASRFLEGE